MILLLKLICSKLLNLTKGENSEKLFEKAQNIIKFLQFKFSTKSNELKLLPDKYNSNKFTKLKFDINLIVISEKTPLVNPIFFILGSSYLIIVLLFISLFSNLFVPKNNVSNSYFFSKQAKIL